VNAPDSVILTLPEGTNHVYRIPNHAKFTIDGEKQTAFDLKKRMIFEATIITDDSETVIERSKSVVGQTPPRRRQWKLAFCSSRSLRQHQAFQPARSNPRPIVQSKSRQPCQKPAHTCLWWGYSVRRPSQCHLD
jgi:hypothetical protein